MDVLAVVRWGYIHRCGWNIYEICGVPVLELCPGVCVYPRVSGECGLLA